MQDYLDGQERMLRGLRDAIRRVYDEMDDMKGNTDQETFTYGAYPNVHGPVRIKGQVEDVIEGIDQNLEQVERARERFQNMSQSL